MLGAHVRYTQARGGLKRSIQDAETMGFNVFQVFIKTNLRWMTREKLVEGDIIRFQDRKNIQKISVHSIYLTNLASDDETIRRKSINSLINEIEIMGKMGMDPKEDFIVVHMGYNDSVTEGLHILTKSLNEVLEKTESFCILLENSAGQRRSIGSKLEHLIEVKEKVSERNRLFFCLDTAHLFASGYDINPDTLENIKETLGSENIKLIHLNDSKSGLNSKKDLHEFLGKGKIGYQKLQMFIEEFKEKPFVLETPISNLERLEEYREDLNFIRGILKQN
jgi:apurinic endonuclease APN1